ncbi:MAG: CoA pyrophosphatase [Ornithinimicrobium sp.]
MTSAAVPPLWFDELVAQVEGRQGESFSRFLPPPGGGRRQSAVLMLFGPGVGGTEVVLTERAHTMRSHPGQVSFPGGGHEVGDADATATALREAREEIGLSADGVSVLAELPALHIPVSGYDVTPVLAWWHQPGAISVRDPAEVQQVLRVPVADLVDPARRFRVRHPSGYTGPGFGVGSVMVWGFTASLLDRVFDLAGVTQPWDPSVVREVR